MRRSKNGSAEQQARGNFTPPPRAAASPADVLRGAHRAGGSSSRLSPAQLARADPAERDPAHPRPRRPRHGRLPGEGLDRHLAGGPGRREDRAASCGPPPTYGQALLNERDLTAAAAARRTSARTSASSAGRTRPPTRPRPKFDAAVEDMPEKQGLERRLEALPARRSPSSRRCAQAAYTARPRPGVKTEEGYVEVQHSLMEFSNELGLGTGNITSYGRTVYAIAAGQGRRVAAALHRHAPAGPPEPRTTASLQRASVIAFASYAYLEQHRPRRVHLRRHRRRTSSRLKDGHGQREGRRGRQEARPQRQGRAAGTPSVRRRPDDGSVFDGMAHAIGQRRQRPTTLAGEGHHPRDLVGRRHRASSTATRTIEKELVDKAVNEAAEHLRRRQARRHRQRRHRRRRPARRLHPGRR